MSSHSMPFPVALYRKDITGTSLLAVVQRCGSQMQANQRSSIYPYQLRFQIKKNNSSKGVNAIKKHKATQLLRSSGISTNMELSGPDTNLGNLVLIVKAPIFISIFTQFVLL